MWEKRCSNYITLSGTTLDMIDIPLDEKSFMFDTPGIIQSHQMTNYVSENELKIIIPKMK